MAAVRLLGNAELDLLAPDTTAPHVADRHRHAVQPQTRRQLLQPRGRDAEGQERTQRHVAADAGGGIENGDAHGAKYRNINGLGLVTATRRRY